jgi:hypothetical protein
MHERERRLLRQSQTCKHQWAKREQFRRRTRSIGYWQLQGTKKLTSAKAKRRFGISEMNVNIGDNSGLRLASHESRDGFSPAQGDRQHGKIIRNAPKD